MGQSGSLGKQSPFEKKYVRRQPDAKLYIKGEEIKIVPMERGSESPSAGFSVFSRKKLHEQLLTCSC